MARKEKLVVTIVDENGLRQFNLTRAAQKLGCLLYTSDAADDYLTV